ncbi:MAG: hypothetical protein ABL901_03950 [Hyphomicrobiaceae bacterium]
MAFNAKFAQLAVAAAVAAAPHVHKAIQGIWTSKDDAKAKQEKMEREIALQIETAVDKALITQSEKHRDHLLKIGLALFALGLILGGLITKYALPAFGLMR